MPNVLKGPTPGKSGANVIKMQSLEEEHARSGFSLRSKEVGVSVLYLTLIGAMLAAQWVAWPAGVSVHQVQAGMLIATTLAAWAFGRLG